MVLTRLGARTRSARPEILSSSGVAPPSAWRPALISRALSLARIHTFEVKRKAMLPLELHSLVPVSEPEPEPGSLCPRRGSMHSRDEFPEGHCRLQRSASRSLSSTRMSVSVGFGSGFEFGNVHGLQATSVNVLTLNVQPMSSCYVVGVFLSASPMA